MKLELRAAPELQKELALHTTIMANQVRRLATVGLVLAAAIVLAAVLVRTRIPEASR